MNTLYAAASAVMSIDSDQGTIPPSCEKDARKSSGRSAGNSEPPTPTATVVVLDVAVPVGSPPPQDEATSPATKIPAHHRISAYINLVGGRGYVRR
jgi:hypothetical protein